MNASDSATYRRLSRGAGLLGLLVLTINIPDQGPFFSDDSPAQIARWVQTHPTALYVEGLTTGLTMLLVAGLLGVLMWRTGRRGWPAGVVGLLLAANVGVDMVWGGAYYTLAKAGQMHVGDSGILSLFYLAQELTFTDGFLFGIAMVVIFLTVLRTRTLPVPLAWLGLLVGAFHVVATPLQVAISHTVEGATGPASAVLFLVWLLATSLALLISPGRAPRAADGFQAVGRSVPTTATSET